MAYASKECIVTHLDIISWQLMLGADRPHGGPAGRVIQKAYKRVHDVFFRFGHFVDDHSF